MTAKKTEVAAVDAAPDAQVISDAPSDSAALMGEGTSDQALSPAVNDKNILLHDLPPAEIGVLAFPEKEAIPALWIRAVSKQGFRRCGFFFPHEGVGIALSALTEGQIEQLRREPNLVMELSEFSDSLEG